MSDQNWFCKLTRTLIKNKKCFRCSHCLKTFSKILDIIFTVNSGGSRIFPRGGANSQKCYYFSIFCRKLHESERIWTPRGGRASLAPPLGSANGKCINIISTSVKSYPTKCVEMKAADSTGLYDNVFFIRNFYKKVIFDCKFC